MAINSRLFMEVGFVNSEFQAIDKTPYERWINDGYLDNSHEHIVLQRLLKITDGDEPIPVDSISVKVTNDIDELRDAFIRPDLTNGLYYYQKMLIPSEEHITQTNEKLYFDSENMIHYVDSDSDEHLILNPTSNFSEIYDILREKYPDNCFYFDDYSFTIYSLIECYVLLERERINDYLKNNCKENCKKGNEDSLKADILLAAIMVIKDLMDKEDYFEAQRILNGLNTCKGLCSKFVKTLKGCGCGGA